LPVGVLRAGGTGPNPAILLVTGTEGLNTDYVVFARELTWQGFDVAIGCWFDSGKRIDAADPRISCRRAPEFKGVTDGAVSDLDALVDGARVALGEPDHLALVGFSRGGGIAMLRASRGAPEPVVSIAGMVEGTTAWGAEPGEVDVVERAPGIVAPVLILHGVDDGLIGIDQARAMEGALRALGADVAVKYYAGVGHGLAQVPRVRRDMQATIAGFLCDRFGCGVTGTEIEAG
jgi:dienelactone hydrolase